MRFETDEILKWYETLDLPPYSSIQAVKRRYRTMAKIHHPDVMGGVQETGDGRIDDKMKQINTAYENIVKRTQGMKPGERH